MRRKKINVLFLSLLDFQSLSENNIYTDLLLEFIENGHYVVAISPIEKKNNREANNIICPDYSIYKPVIGNIQKTNIFEKGISTILFEKRIIKQLKKINIKFDIVIYSTPPVTFAKCIKYIKNRDGSKSYLLLKDIFPQNAIDLGLLKKRGVYSFIYTYFRNKEKALYALSDSIGCMSIANKKYLLANNNIDESKIEINPNTERDINQAKLFDKKTVLTKHGIILGKIIFIYGGNIGKPQGVHFIKECIYSFEERADCLFLIVGSGTEFNDLEFFLQKNGIKNTILMEKLPRDEFENLVRASDVGMLFLDYKFTIPNFPSRLLSYMKMKKPVFMAIDKNTDVGDVARSGGFGDFCYSNDIEGFKNMLDKFISSYDLVQMGKCAYDYFKLNYISSVSYSKIIEKMENIICT